MKSRVGLTVLLVLVSVVAVLDGTSGASGAAVLQGHMTGIFSTYSLGSVTPLSTFNPPSATIIQPTQSFTLPQPETSFTFNTVTIPTLPISTFFTVHAKSTLFSSEPSTTTVEPSTTTVILTTSTTVSLGSTDTWNTWGYGGNSWGYGCSNWNGCYYTTGCSYYGCYNSNCYYNYNNCYYQPPNNCYPGYPSYPNCSPNYGYPETPMTTATAYSLLTETSTTTQTSVSTPNPLYITNTFTTVATDTTMETLYGSLMAIFLVLFLASLFLLARPKSKSKADSTPALAQTPPTQRQPAYVKTSYKCSACGSEVLPKMKFCGDCGAQLKHDAPT